MATFVAPYLAVLGIVDFRRFWIGFLFSTLGNEFTRVAFVWFVYEETGSAEALGILMVCFTGPIVIGGFMAGWLLDRFDRRVVLIADNLIRGTAIGSIPILYGFDALAVWHVYVAAAVYGFLMMIELAGTPTLIPSLVPQDKLAIANALEVLGFTLGGVFGPVLAGLLIAAIGAPLTVVVDVATYFLFAVLLLGMRIPPTAAATAAPGSPSARKGYGSVFWLMAGNSVLLSTTLMFFVFNIGSGMSPVWLPIFVETILGGGSEVFGALLGVAAVGQTISSMVAGGIAGRIPLGLSICLVQTLAGAASLLILVFPNLLATAAAMFLGGIAGAPMTIWAQTLRMAIIPPEMRGRAFALLRMLMQSGRPIGGALAGAVLTPLGLPTVIALSVVLVAVPGLAGLAVPALRKAGVPVRRERS